MPLIEKGLKHLYDSSCDACIHAQCYYEKGTWTIYCDKGHIESEHCNDYKRLDSDNRISEV